MKRNTLTTAVVAGLTGMAGMVSVTNAVNVDPEGTGQVLLYPYYSAHGGNDTLVSIVNSTNRGKAVKIRFREAINSRDVLDFHIYMSAYDVWTAAVTKASDTDGAMLKISDTTCTVPYLFESVDGEQEFLDFDYNTKKDDTTDPKTASTIDGGPTGIDRTASGYIEVIEMGTLEAHPAKEPVDKDGKITDAGAYVSWATKHTSKGVPNDCDALVNAWTENAPTSAKLGSAWLDDGAAGTTGISAPTGGLYGAASIINVSDGTMFSYNATAIDNFIGDTNANHTKPGQDKPNLLTVGGQTVANVFESGFEGFDVDGNGTLSEGERRDEDNNPNVVSQQFTKYDEASKDRTTKVSALLALDAVLMADSIANEYVTDSASGAETEWVVTMPTKRFRADGQKFTAGNGGGKVPLAPFTRTFAKDKGACEDMSFTYWDREEQDSQSAATPKPPVVSPAPPPGAPAEVFSLCREANVIRFASDGSYPDASGIFKEPKRADTPFGYTNFELDYSEGWVSLDLVNVPKDSKVGPAERKSVPATQELDLRSTDDVAPIYRDLQRDVFKGLPVIGFAATTYSNGNLGDGVLANYGGTFQHRTSRTIASSS